jgi:hypothetical protein
MPWPVVRVTDELVAALDAARDAFLRALGKVDEALATTPGVVDGWSVRDLVVHIAFWCEHGADALDLATAGRGSAFGYDTAQTDAINARVAADAAAVPPAAALEREAGAFRAFRERIVALDRTLLAHRLGNGDTVEAVIRYDGPDHYAEHTAHLHEWFGDDDEADADA